MNNGDILELCFRNLLRRRARTVLAVVGVVVGTCAIVVMLSIGFGLSEGFQEQIESYGTVQTTIISPTALLFEEMDVTRIPNIVFNKPYIVAKP